MVEKRIKEKLLQPLDDNRIGNGTITSESDISESDTPTSPITDPMTGAPS